jgi:hypothetical protein
MPVPPKEAESLAEWPAVIVLAERWVVVVVLQIGPVMVLSFNVTVPTLNAKNRPFKVAPEFIAFTPSCEITVPMNEVVVSRVVEEPILHHTLQGSPPVTDEPGDVMSVDTVLKIHTPVFPVRARCPVSKKLPAEQYTPGTRGESRVRSCPSA